MTDAHAPLSAAAIAREVLAGRSSALEQAEAALARASAYDAVQPQAWIARRPPSQVRAAAQSVDARLRAGERLPLAGVPFAVKDNIDAEGLDTTAACPSFAYRPAVSAAVVRRLEAAGAVLIGKTNLDQFATGLVGTRSPHGAPACVFQREYVSGGSSSGSAVLVGAGVLPLALGSDTAGSGRVPAAFNGIVGHKPTRGRWSATGLVPACRSLDCVSAFTAGVADAALADAVLAGFDGDDPYARRAPAAAASFGPAPRLGVARAAQLDFLGDTASAALHARAQERLLACGARPVEVDIAPLLDAAQLLYSGPWVAERTAAVGDFLRRQPSAVHPVVRAILQAGAGLPATDVFHGLHALQRYLREAERLWEAIDVLLLPTAPTIYRIAEVLAEPVALNSRLGTYTNFVNLLDMSALALPAGHRANGTGYGVSLIAPAWSDGALFELGARYEAQAGADARPALDLSARAPHVQLAVAGAHLCGLPLHWQLASRAARLVARTRTAPAYRMYALPGPPPARPALVHVGAGGSAIEVEVYELDSAAFGSFVAEIPAPLAIGKLVLADGTSVPGFVAEPRALDGATDISALGGWRAYLAQEE
jgi:allophanate hydrolase